MQDKKLEINSDFPVEYIENDLFNTTSFVDSFYDLLNTLSPERGFVISLNGEWGSGKSTILNFLKEKVVKEGNDSSFTIMDFTPWNIIDQQTLLRSFFTTLKNCILKEQGNRKIIKLLEKYYLLIIEGLKLVPKINSITQLIDNLFTFIIKDNDKSIFDIKNEIITYLGCKYSGKKIVIFIDDLDRLTDEEICIVLRLIKEIADFPKIIYVISMDKKHVINAIENYYKYPKNTFKGALYLEKFIQLERNLPQINSKLEILFKEEIKEIIGKDNFEIQSKYFKDIFDKCLKEKLTTPRKMILFLNQYRLSYQKIKDYINFVDYMAILYFQLFIPDLYQFLKENQTILTCNYKTRDSIPTEYNTQLINEGLRKLSCNENYARNVINNLFPAWQDSCGYLRQYTPKFDFMFNYVRCPERFDNYFGQVDYNTKSSVELIEMVDNCDENEILEYISYPDYQTENDAINKSKYLFNCWEFLNFPIANIEKILLAILKYSNNSKNLYYWYEIISENIFEHLSKETVEHIYLKILIEKNVSNIYKSYIYILYKANEIITKKFISDNMCIQIIQLYLNNVINLKKKLDLDEKIIIDLLLKLQLFTELEKYIKKYRDHSSMLIYLLLNDKDYQLKYIPNKLLEYESKNSEDFWKTVGRKEFEFLKDCDINVITYLKKESYLKYDSIFGANVEAALKNYLRLANIKV